MTQKRGQDHRLHRLDDSRLVLPNRYDIPVRLFASSTIPMEREAVDQLLEVLALQETVEAMQEAAPDFFGGSEAHVRAVSISPDFHRGSSIPIGTTIATSGFAVPQAIGNDVNCGMRLLTTGLTREQVTPHLDALEQRLRHIFFEGGRNIALTPQQRTALLSEGLPGLLNADVFRGADRDAAAHDLERTHGRGGYTAPVISALNDYVQGSGGASYDSLLGSLGGGNHFCEVQYIQRVLDKAAAHAWGIREGQVVIMVHSGSLGLGHVANKSVLDAMMAIYPTNLPRPKNGIYVLPEGERYAAVFDHFRAAMRNAANFAFGNRMYLARMVARALEDAVGAVDAQLIYDAPHNLLWENEGDDRVFLHRKGATPARGWESMDSTPYAYWGEPVIVPGSMGAASYLLRGSGNDDALRTACHGAGRALSRGAAMRVDDAQLDAFLRTFRVVTPVDIRRPDVRGRRDILVKWREAVKQEAGWAYKDVAPVIETLRNADVAQPVAEFFPLITVKG